MIRAPSFQKKKKVSSCWDVFLAYLGSLKDQQMGGGLAVWDAVGPSGHEMSLFQPSGSFYLT